MKGFDKQFKNFLFALKDMFITIWLIDQRVYRQMEKKKTIAFSTVWYFSLKGFHGVERN